MIELRLAEATNVKIWAWKTIIVNQKWGLNGWRVNTIRTAGVVMLDSRRGLALGAPAPLALGADSKEHISHSDVTCKPFWFINGN